MENRYIIIGKNYISSLVRYLYTNCNAKLFCNSKEINFDQVEQRFLVNNQNNKITIVSEDLVLTLYTYTKTFYAFYKYLKILRDLLNNTYFEYHVSSTVPLPISNRSFKEEFNDFEFVIECLNSNKKINISPMYHFTSEQGMEGLAYPLCNKVKCSGANNCNFLILEQCFLLNANNLNHLKLSILENEPKLMFTEAGLVELPEISSGIGISFKEPVTIFA